MAGIDVRGKAVRVKAPKPPKVSRRPLDSGDESIDHFFRPLAGSLVANPFW